MFLFSWYVVTTRGWDVQIVYLVRVGNTDAWAMLSVATSWWSLGMGIGKIVLLKDLLPYRNKQAC